MDGAKLMFIGVSCRAYDRSVVAPFLVFVGHGGCPEERDRHGSCALPHCPEMIAGCGFAIGGFFVIGEGFANAGDLDGAEDGFATGFAEGYEALGQRRALRARVPVKRGMIDWRLDGLPNDDC